MAIHSYDTITPRIGKVKGVIFKHATPVEALTRTGNQHKIDKNTGDTVIFRRYMPVGATTTDANTINRWSINTPDYLTQEGVTPAAKTVSSMDITVQLDQYSVLYSYTDKVAKLYEDNIPTYIKERVGQEMGLLREKIAYGALKGCTNKYYSGGTSRATVDETISLPMLRKICRGLQANHAKPITHILSATPDYGTSPIGQGYLVYVHTDAAHDVRELPGFVNFHEYASGQKYHPMELGAVDEFRFILSPELNPIINSGAAVGTTNLLSTGGSNIDVYPFIIVAEDAWGSLALRGNESFEVIHHSHNQKDKSDPLGQRGYIGAIFYQTCFIQNDGWMAVLEAGLTNL